MAEDEYNTAVSTANETENEESSPTSSVLILHYSSSSFESHNSSSDSDESSHRVEPYLYEPEGSGTEDTREYPDDICDINEGRPLARVPLCPHYPISYMVYGCQPIPMN